MISYQEALKVFNQMKSVSSYEEAQEVNKAAQNVFSSNMITVPKRSNNDVSVTVTPQPQNAPEWFDYLSTIFPPALILKASDTTPVGGSQMPVTTISGSAEGVGEFVQSNPVVQTTDPTDSISGIFDLVIKVAPILILMSLIGSIKKVF